MVENKVGGFIIANGETYAGKHLLIDLYGCSYGTITEISDVLIEAAKATGATVLFNYSHPFDGGGSSGVIVLAESHLSYHLWEDEKFIALDIFVCGTCNPFNALPILKDYFKPSFTSMILEKRGKQINQSKLIDK